MDEVYTRAQSVFFPPAPAAQSIFSTTTFPKKEAGFQKK